MLGVIAVAIGGALGSAARYGAMMGAGRWLGPDYPYGTLFVNVLGSALIGLLYGLFQRVWPAPQEVRLLLTTGLMGSFTTFSIFSLDVVQLAEKGNSFTAVSYVVLSVLASVAALGFTLVITRAVT